MRATSDFFGKRKFAAALRTREKFFELLELSLRKIGELLRGLNVGIAQRGFGLFQVTLQPLLSEGEVLLFLLAL